MKHTILVLAATLAASVVYAQPAQPALPPGNCLPQRTVYRAAIRALAQCTKTRLDARPERCFGQYQAERKALLEQKIACSFACNLDAWQAGLAEARLVAVPGDPTSMMARDLWRISEAEECRQKPSPPTPTQAEILRRDAQPVVGTACVVQIRDRWATGTWRREPPPAPAKTWGEWWRITHGPLDPSRWWWADMTGWECAVSPPAPAAK